MFLSRFADCFGRREARELLRVYVKGQLSDLHRKNVEAIAVEFGKAPRTLQRFLESIKWDERKLRDYCQRMVAQEHAHRQAIGTVDESGTTKSGKATVGVGRQYNGNRGKLDNCVVGVHLRADAFFSVVAWRRGFLRRNRCETPFARPKPPAPEQRPRLLPNR